MRSVVVSVLLLVPSVASAQQTYTLKLPPKAKGDVRQVDVDTQQTIRTLKLDSFGAELKDNTSASASKLTYKDDYLDVDRGQLTSYRRHFETATESVNGGDPKPLSIHGKTLVIDGRPGTKAIYTWEDGKPLTDDVGRHLAEGLEKDKVGGMAPFQPLPDHPVKVGESWNIDVSAIVQDCETKHGCKLSGATGVGTLRQVNQGPKGPSAQVEVHINVPLRTIQGATKALDLNDGSGTTLDAVYDFALGEGDTFCSSTIKMRFLATGMEPESFGTTTRVRIDMSVELKERQGAPSR